MEKSPQQVAFDLLIMVGRVENKEISGVLVGKEKTDRTWILDTYAECLWAATGQLKPPNQR